MIKELTFMAWNECQRHFIRSIEIDKEKVESLVKMAIKRLEFIKPIKVNKDNTSFVVENYYEIIKELLVALLLKNGLRSQNHQCLISYFYKNYPNYEFEAHLILQMSYLRNRLEYYGESIDIDFYNKNKESFISVINLIKNIVEQ